MLLVTYMCVCSNQHALGGVSILATYITQTYARYMGGYISDMSRKYVSIN